MQYILTEQEYEDLKAKAELSVMLEKQCSELEEENSALTRALYEESKKSRALYERTINLDSDVINLGYYDPDVAKIIIEELKKTKKKASDGKIHCGSIKSWRVRGRQLNDKGKAEQKRRGRGFTQSIPLEYAKKRNIYLTLNR